MYVGLFGSYFSVQLKFLHTLVIQCCLTVESLHDNDKSFF